MSLRIFGGPQRYLQGPGALRELGDLAALFGRRAFVVADEIVMSLLKSDLDRSLSPLEHAEFGAFGGECTADEIDRLAELARSDGADVVIGVGGGKAIDTAKGARKALGLPLIVVPTIASNDSPTSRLIVVYTPEHVIAEVRLMDANPEAVLVDTEIIARAPARFFVAGVGDALSKKFEVEQCHRAKGRNFYGGSPTDLAVSVADACYLAIRQNALAARAAVERRTPDASLESAIEASILLSGLAFESGGLSIAHSLTRGFSAAPSLSKALHGEQVAVGLLVQLRAEGRDEAFMNDLLGFYREIGLPTSLAALGPVEPGDIEKMAEVTVRTAPYIGHFNRKIDVDGLILALTTV